MSDNRAEEWCACGRHMIDTRNQRPICPVCLDELGKESGHTDADWEVI